MTRMFSQRCRIAIALNAKNIENSLLPFGSNYEKKPASFLCIPIILVPHSENILRFVISVFSLRAHLYEHSVFPTPCNKELFKKLLLLAKHNFLEDCSSLLPLSHSSPASSPHSSFILSRQRSSFYAGLWSQRRYRPSNIANSHIVNRTKCRLCKDFIAKAVIALTTKSTHSRWR